MRAISAVFLCMGLVACDSSDSNPSGSKDGSTENDGAVVVADAGGGTLDAEVEADSAVSDVDAADIDAAVGEDAEVADAALDAEAVVDTSVPDTSVPDTSVPLTADQMLEAQVTAKMRECAVIAATGDYKANKVVDAYDRCLSQCYLATSCPNLKNVFCAGSDLPAALATCIKACSDAPVADGFPCATGNQVIPHLFVCNGETAECTGTSCKHPGCYDGSDEANCPTFACDNMQLLSYYVCDGYTDCETDLKDEVGCAAACPGP